MHHILIQVPSVDVTPDPPTFSLDTTFNAVYDRDFFTFYSSKFSTLVW